MNRADPLTNLIEDANQHFGRERQRDRIAERIAVALERIAELLAQSREETIQ